jgi:hypothetical protein
VHRFGPGRPMFADPDTDDFGARRQLHGADYRRDQG